MKIDLQLFSYHLMNQILLMSLSFVMIFFRMKEIGISPEDKVICFGQLLGMCDYLTFPLGKLENLHFHSALKRHSHKNELLLKTFHKLQKKRKRTELKENLLTRSIGLFGLQIHSLRPGKGSVAIPVAASSGESRNTDKDKERKKSLAERDYEAFAERTAILHA